MLDLIAENETFEIAQVTRLQRMKTGALIAASCEAGAILGKAGDAARHALRAGLTLFDSYHCSRYNTQTRRLSAEAFAAVFGAIRDELEPGTARA